MDSLLSSPFYAHLFGFCLVFFATTAGAIPVRFFSWMSPRIEAVLLGGSGGVMLGATFFSLLLPALDLYQEGGTSPLMSALLVGVILLAGAAFLYVFHQILPHEHFIKPTDTATSEQISRQWLVILAVALHNLPEGLAVGVGLGSGDINLGSTLAIAIALQDFPEGLIVALGLRSLGVPFAKCLMITAMTGLVESIGVSLGFVAISMVQGFLPIAFALCAGAMLFVVSHEVIPESHRSGHEREATAGLLMGFVLMMVLDLGLAG